MNGIALSALLLGPGLLQAYPDDCLDRTAVQPGRWRVESVREGEPPARGVADIVRWEGGCVLLERLVIHFDDGTSHQIVFVQGADPLEGGPQLLQIGDHPLFLIWRPEEGGETYRAERRTERGTVELRWRVRPEGSGFERELLVRRDGASGWSSSEVIRYMPMSVVGDPGDVPPRRPGPFHDPDACSDGEFREMDHLLGQWFNEEWVRSQDGWTPETVSDVTVRPLVGGCALLEEHPVYDDGVISDRLLLLRGYDPSRERWRQLVFGHRGGIWEWALEKGSEGWTLTPVRGEMEGELRILERPDSTGLSKTIQTRADDGTWETRRRIRYVAW